MPKNQYAKFCIKKHEKINLCYEIPATGLSLQSETDLE